MAFLEHYQTISGQQVNKEKSELIITEKASQTRINMMLRMTCFKRGRVPFKYLGIPVYKGRKRIMLFEELIEKVRSRIESWNSKFLSVGGKIVLLQSVLSTLPSYYLQSLKMPREVEIRIERIFNRFLWNGSPWAKWQVTCAPFEEGGLGMRSMTDLHTTFMLKAWLRMRDGKCLWSKFMLAKYCRLNHPAKALVQTTHSRVWKNLAKVRGVAESSIQWQLGRGNCDFWRDSWLDSGPLREEDNAQGGKVPVQEFWRNGEWDYDKLIQVVPPHMAAHIREVHINQGKEDKPYWKTSPDGKFSFKHTFEEIRNSRTQSPMQSVIWHSHIPKKMSFIAWKLIHGWLPVDEVLMKRGLALVSKCVCCKQMETIQHVFFSNSIARQIWEHYAGIVGIKHCSFQNITNVLTTWSYSVTTQGHIRQVIPVIILWALWEARNKAKHTGTTYDFTSIKDRIWNSLLCSSRAGMEKAKYWKGDQCIATALKVRIQAQPKTPPRLLFWIAPPEGQLQLNIDAAFQGETAAYGGVLRNSNGELVQAIGMQGRNTSALEAELHAAQHILEWCVRKGYRRMRVEVDSLTLTKMVRTQAARWDMANKLSQLLDDLNSSGSMMTHVFREKNKVADWMAKHAMQESRDIYWNDKEEHTQLRRIMQLEKEGLPYIRR